MHSEQLSWRSQIKVLLKITQVGWSEADKVKEVNNMLEQMQGEIADFDANEQAKKGKEGFADIWAEFLGNMGIDLE